MKNMKSHYRRKKADLQQGIVQSIEWEYYWPLDRIFSVQEEQPPVTPKVTQTPSKRKLDSPAEKIKCEPEVSPQDL